MKSPKTILLVVGLTIATAAPAHAKCLAKDSAGKALERELELIKTLAVDPAASFRGPGSCVNTDLLTSLDLSALIPDISGMLTSGALDAVNNIIANARTQVCRQINDAITGTITDATSTVAKFNSGLTDELNAVLTNGWGELSFKP